MDSSITYKFLKVDLINKDNVDTFHVVKISDRPESWSRSLSRPFFSDYYPGPGNFQEKNGITWDHFYKSVICSRL